MQESALEYMARMHEQLKGSYSQGLYLASCSHIADELSRLLERPSQVIFYGKTYDGANRFALVPRQYGGKITWGAHIVCVSNDTAYDPMIGVPVELQRYPSIVFTAEVEVQVLLDEEGTAAWLKSKSL